MHPNHLNPTPHVVKHDIKSVNHTEQHEVETPHKSATVEHVEVKPKVSAEVKVEVKIDHDKPTENSTKQKAVVQVKSPEPHKPSPSPSSTTPGRHTSSTQVETKVKANDDILLSVEKELEELNSVVYRFSEKTKTPEAKISPAPSSSPRNSATAKLPTISSVDEMLAELELENKKKPTSLKVEEVKTTPQKNESNKEFDDLFAVLSGMKAEFDIAPKSTSVEKHPPKKNESIDSIPIPEFELPLIKDEHKSAKDESAKVAVEVTVKVEKPSEPIEPVIASKEPDTLHDIPSPITSDKKEKKSKKEKKEKKDKKKKKLKKVRASSSEGELPVPVHDPVPEPKPEPKTKVEPVKVEIPKKEEPKKVDTAPIPPPVTKKVDIHGN